MQKLWMAYLFSCLLPSNFASLEEFFALLGHLGEGSNLWDPSLFSVSSSLQRIEICNPGAISLPAFEIWRGQIQQMQASGIRFTFPGQLDFPSAFLNLNEIPYFLSYIGQPVWMHRVGLAIVGSREPGNLSQAWSEKELPKLFQKLPFFIVSGGARGVDQIAHRICVRTGRPTVAFLPSGLQNVYPQAFAEWIPMIVKAGGAVVSEFFPSQRMQKDHFQRRNRLIAGLSIATLIIDARRRSGTMLTARQTIEQGKPLFVLPSHPMDGGNSGALDLLCDGATPVRDAEDLIIYLSAELQSIKAHNMDIVPN